MQNGRISAALYDLNLAESPSRLDPNKVLIREKQGGHDQNEEEAFRRENYLIFRKNLEEAFNEFNVNQDQYLQREEFYNFMNSRAKAAHQEVS